MESNLRSQDENERSALSSKRLASMLMTVFALMVAIELVIPASVSAYVDLHALLVAVIIGVSIQTLLDQKIS